MNSSASADRCSAAERSAASGASGFDIGEGSRLVLEAPRGMTLEKLGRGRRASAARIPHQPARILPQPPSRPQTGRPRTSRLSSSPMSLLPSRWLRRRLPRCCPRGGRRRRPQRDSACPPVFSAVAMARALPRSPRCNRHRSRVRTVHAPHPVDQVQGAHPGGGNVPKLATPTAAASLTQCFLYRRD